VYQFIDLPVPFVHRSLQVPNMLDWATPQVKPAMLESEVDGNGESDVHQGDQNASLGYGSHGVKEPVATSTDRGAGGGTSPLLKVKPLIRSAGSQSDMPSFQTWSSGLILSEAARYRSVLLSMGLRVPCRFAVVRAGT
jgi:hypothetical protein